MTRGDRFTGGWRVTEYVYAPEGAAAGMVRQRRILDGLEGGRTRVAQTCTPEGLPPGHPCQRFAGTWMFDLERDLDGTVRRYVGPDVVGTGVAHGEFALTGRGLWPRFGYNFTSYSVLSGQRQITGGVFSTARTPVAVIVGVAIPETAGEAQWPKLEGPTWPGEVAMRWTGTLESFAPGGRLERRARIERSYTGERAGEARISEWENGDRTWTIELSPGRPEVDVEVGVRRAARGGRRLVSGRVAGSALAGNAIMRGWSLEIEAVAGPAMVIESTEVLDGGAGALVALRRLWRDEAYVRTEVLRLEVA